MIVAEAEIELRQEGLPGLEKLSFRQLEIVGFDGDVEVVFKRPGDRFVQGQRPNGCLQRPAAQKPRRSLTERE